jgi:hypothetical protein
MPLGADAPRAEVIRDIRRACIYWFERTDMVKAFEVLETSSPCAAISRRPAPPEGPTVDGAALPRTYSIAAN